MNVLAPKLYQKEAVEYLEAEKKLAYCREQLADAKQELEDCTHICDCRDCEYSEDALERNVRWRESEVRKAEDASKAVAIKLQTKIRKARA